MSEGVEVSIQFSEGSYWVKGVFVEKGALPVEVPNLSLCADYDGCVVVNLNSRFEDVITIYLDGKRYTREISAGFNSFLIDSKYADGIIGVALDDDGEPDEGGDEKPGLREFLERLRDLIDGFLEEDE